MFGRRAEVRVLLSDVIDKFREKGATSPDTAMTVQKRGLFSKFDDLMKRGKGRLGTFVEVEGKYYSLVERLKEAGEQRLEQQFRRRLTKNNARMSDKKSLSGVGESRNTQIFYSLHKVMPTFTEEYIRRQKPARYKIQPKAIGAPNCKNMNKERGL